MCLIDLAISRRSTVKITQVAAATFLFKLPASPDRVAVYCMTADANDVVYTLGELHPGDGPCIFASSTGGEKPFGLTYLTHPGIVSQAMGVGDTSGSAFAVVEVILSNDASREVQAIVFNPPRK